MIAIRGLLLMLLCTLSAWSALDTLAAEDASMSRELLARIRAAYVFVHGGSGVVIDASGLVLTNHHVIDGENPKRLKVRFANGRTYGATLLGSDPFGDLALLRIRSSDTFTAAPLATANDLRAGIAVWAVGNPFGLGNADNQPTLSAGVLSTGRISRGNYTDAVQTDAPVNPGNSGGPLFDVAGRLLGINGQIRTITGMRVNSGIGLAIAATQIADFLPYLLSASGGVVRHAACPRDLKFSDSDDGPMVLMASASSALRVGDRITHIHQRPIVSADNARGVLASTPWRRGATAAVQVIRDGAAQNIDLALVRMSSNARPYIGWQFDDRTVDGQRVAMVTYVDEGSPAWTAGIRPRAIIQRINDTAIASRAQVLTAMAEIEPTDHITVQCRIGDSEKVFQLTVGER